MSLRCLLSFALCLLVASLSIATASASSSSPAAVSFNELSANEADPTTPTPAPSVTNDLRKILRSIGSVPCSESARHSIFALFYESNEDLHDRCVQETGYRFFPYTGKLPTDKQILAIVKSTRCMELYSGIVLADLPECDIDFVSAKSAAEVYLRIKKDVDENRPAPSQDEFYELYNLNRVVNLITTNASLVEEAFKESTTPTAVSVAELRRIRTPAVPLPNVRLGDHFKILTDDAQMKQTPSEAPTRETPAEVPTKEAQAVQTPTSGSSSGTGNLRFTPTPSSEAPALTSSSEASPHSSRRNSYGLFIIATMLLLQM